MSKPPYRVPLMEEIRAIPWNGLTVASTFSGGGGSCTGYRMAGFCVAWANEFVPSAQASYSANHPETYLDCRDIKLVRTEEILAQVGMAPGDLDLFDGSPPCQAFSTAGKREKGWGKDKLYEHGAKQKNETLFSEYIRLLRGLKPKTFVAENVSGLAKGTAKGWFLEILAGLKACGYRVACRRLDAQWLGVPQMRQRLIFVGVREDLGREPAFPAPLPYRYSVRDACPWIVGVEEMTGYNGHRRLSSESPSQTIVLSGSHHCFTEMIVGNDAFQPKWGAPDVPSPTIMSGGAHGGSGEIRNRATSERRRFTIAEVKRICAFPDDYTLVGSYAQQWERLGNSVPPVMMFHIASAIRDGVLQP